jgi:8-oxo-dGTP diphosphatase
MTETKEQRVGVGIGVTILKDGKILLGKRRGSHGAGEFATPGGRLEYRESFEQCARREVKEECGLEIENIRFHFVTNLMQYPPSHFAHIGLLADWKSGEPRALEPEKCEGWDWYPLDALPEPLFAPTKTAIESLVQGFSYRDSKGE